MSGVSAHSGRGPWRSIARAAIGFGAAVAWGGAALCAEPVPPVGDLHQQYLFEGGSAPAHFRLYVPTGYDPRKAYPLVVVLHGSGEDENRPVDRSDLEKIAQERGYIMLAPFGSRRGGFGNCYPVVVTRETAASLPNPLAPPRPPPEGANRPSPNVRAAADDYVYQTATELQPDYKVAAQSEKETMAVLGLVRRQYNVDPSRIYLMGNSMGGLGTAYLAARYPEVWAAISPEGGPVAAWSYPFERLRDHHIAALFVHGEYDEHASPHWSQVLADAAKAEGVDAAFLIVPGGHHGDAWTKVLPQTFDFFDRHVNSQH